VVAATVPLLPKWRKLPESYPGHRGGIGRRAWFRSMYPQGCGGSSPFDGTKISSDPKSLADAQTPARKEAQVDAKRMRFESESRGDAREIPRAA
jgi:hypothetical protein